MGTNYYYHTDNCPHCGRGDEPLHIGKSSGGWCFSLHVYPRDEWCKEQIIIESLDDWKALWATGSGTIKDEYGGTHTPEEMLTNITERAWERGEGNYGGYPSWQAFHRANCSQQGPNGLVRSRVDGAHCVGHGKGTWDLIVGEFS